MLSDLMPSSLTVARGASEVVVGEWPRLFSWNIKQYYSLNDLGFFFGKRVELVRGQILEIESLSPAAAVAIGLSEQQLRLVFGNGFLVFSRMPLRLGELNEPEPDVAVVEGAIRDFTHAHPTTAKLVVEVAESSLRYDRKEKAELYAQNRIEEYWILNLKKRCLEVYRRPVKDKNLGFAYAEIFVVGETESVSPLTKPNSKIRVSDMLP